MEIYPLLILSSELCRAEKVVVIFWSLRVEFKLVFWLSEMINCRNDKQELDRELKT